MEQKDKELLLKDLCARLPYGVRVKELEPIKELELYLTSIYHDTVQVETMTGGIMACSIEAIKPYLRPISSLTPEECNKLFEILDIREDDGDWLKINDINILRLFTENGKDFYEIADAIDYLYSIHVDFRDMIEKGLALEAPEGMYNKEESEKRSEIPIPKTVDEAIKTLAKIVSKEDRDYLLENGAISMHDSLGRWIRNEWGLWTGSKLKNELKKKGFEHPDDMSNYIIEEFIEYCWNNKI